MSVQKVYLAGIRWRLQVRGSAGCLGEWFDVVGGCERLGSGLRTGAAQLEGHVHKLLAVLLGLNWKRWQKREGNPDLRPHTPPLWPAGLRSRICLHLAVPVTVLTEGFLFGLRDCLQHSPCPSLYIILSRLCKAIGISHAADHCFEVGQQKTRMFF